MPELVAVGPKPKQRWRREVPCGTVVRLGRAPRDGWAVPWDRHISREHAELELIGPDRMRVRRLDVARNVVVYRGKAADTFELAVGEEFGIGLTKFFLTGVEVSGSDYLPVEEQSFGPGELRRFSFRNAGHRLEVLSQLPRVIAEAASNEQLALGLVRLLLEAVPHAGAAAVIQYPAEFDQIDPANPITLRWDCRDDTSLLSSADLGRFRPSRRLIMDALESGSSVLHIWGEQEEDPAYTTTGRFDWAFCTPLTDVSCRGWCIYVSGRFGFGTGSSSRVVSEDDLRGDLRFAELIAEFMGAIRRVKMLEQQQAGLSHFFSPAVMEMLRQSNSGELLAPRQTEITSLFCDVRGFSRRAEQAESDLHALLGRVSDALGVMTCAILKYDGVIADFQGDAALGFWGWPAATEDGRLAACRAALEIQQQFLQSRWQSKTASERFHVGIGIAHGLAIAGKIGTDEQAKVGVFGSVVNLGSRLEGLTKTLRVPIVIDEATAGVVREELAPNEARCRRLGCLRPYGMQSAVMAYELLPPAEFPGTISDQVIRDYEAAVDAVFEGRWDEALEMLDALPVTDRAKDFLIIFMAQNNYEPPPDWDGVIDMVAK